MKKDTDLSGLPVRRIDHYLSEKEYSMNTSRQEMHPIHGNF